MNITYLGSKCAIEHIFDKNYSYYSYYSGIIDTQNLNLITTPLCGSSAPVDVVAEILNDPSLFLKTLRISSDTTWICQEHYKFVIHNFYKDRPKLIPPILQMYFKRNFDLYKTIDIFIYCSLNFKNINQIFDILNACKKYNSNAKLLVFSNLNEFKENDVWNINSLSSILYSEKKIDSSEFLNFENVWYISKKLISKIKSLDLSKF